MKTFFKIFAGVIVLIIIAVVAFIYTFDANNYKKEIKEIAESRIGLPVNIAGDVDISIYPWIGIKINDVSIENGPGFSKKKFANIGQFDIRINITPLFQKYLDIETIVLHRLEVDFEKNAAGKNNWSVFSQVSDGDAVESEYGLSGFAIGGIEMKNSRLSWLDVNTGKQFKISTMNLGTEAVVKGQPLPLTINAFVESNQPEWQASIVVKTKLEFSDNAVAFNANDLKLVAKALLPGTKIEKLSFAMIADSEIDPQKQTAKLTKARLSVLGLVVDGTFDMENIFSVPVIQGPIKIKTFKAETLAKHLNIDMPMMANTNSLKSISLSASFKTDFDSIYLDEILANIDETSVNGFVHVVGMNRPVIRYDLNADKIKLHDYRSINDESTQDEIPLPLDFLRTVDLEGKIGVEAITIDDVAIDKFHVASSGKGGVIKFMPISMLVGKSEVKATMQLDARKTPIGVVAVKVNNVEARSSINPMLASMIGDDVLNIDGIVNASASIKANGKSVAALKKSAKGEIKINMGKTIIQGIDLSHTSRAVAAAYANKNNFKTRPSFVTKYDPGQKTEFKSLRGTFNVTRGKLVNKDLLLVSDKANITGSGSIDFINGKLDYRPVIDMHIKNTVDMRDKFRDHPMEYHVRGKFKNIENDFDIEKYELLLGRVLIQEGKRRRNVSKKNKSGNEWKNVLSK